MQKWVVGEGVAGAVNHGTNDPRAEYSIQIAVFVEGGDFALFGNPGPSALPSGARMLPNQQRFGYKLGAIEDVSHKMRANLFEGAKAKAKSPS